jgi:hypothetical protein
LQIAVRWRQWAAENTMKIYLLMLLVGSLFAAIRFTAVPEQPSKPLPQ